MTTRYCPHCDDYLPITEFGICRARPDGLNRYCRKSVNIKIGLQRQALKEYKAAHPSLVKPAKQIDINFSPRRIARMLRKLSPADRVREAIRCGAREQKEIAQVTRLPKDEVCESIAQLLLWEHSIRTEIIKNVRMYFINDGSALSVRRQPVKQHEPHSYGVSNIYFAA